MFLNVVLAVLSPYQTALRGSTLCPWDTDCSHHFYPHRQYRIIRSSRPTVAHRECLLGKSLNELRFMRTTTMLFKCAWRLCYKLFEDIVWLPLTVFKMQFLKQGCIMSHGHIYQLEVFMGNSLCLEIVDTIIKVDADDSRLMSQTYVLAYRLIFEGRTAFFNTWSQ